jgi:hypothetical protein
MEVSDQLHPLAAFIPRERAPSTHWIGGWVGPRVGLDAVEKRKILHCWESTPGHPAHSYTDSDRKNIKIKIPSSVTIFNKTDKIFCCLVRFGLKWQTNSIKGTDRI